MRYIHSGQTIETDDNILLYKWKEPDVTGDAPVVKPEMCIFNNTANALKLLNKHINLHSRIALHTDVDVDGIGSTYIVNQFLKTQGIDKPLLIINKDKVHGIQQKHADYFNKTNIGVDLLIITDSSTNEIDTIKQFNCDVLVIDHHDVLQWELSGNTNDNKHEFVIVNNTIDNSNFEQDKLWLKAKNSEAFNNIDDYKGDSRMSCGLVIYELLRVYCECFSNPAILENLMLYQWVGVTLLTDAIQLLTPRNQWYMDMTVHNQDEEIVLRTIQHNVNKYKATLDKTYINYSFAPIINKAIRAGESAKALDIIINKPDNILELNIYRELQEDAVNKVVYTNYKTIKSLRKPYIDSGWTVEAADQDLKLKGYALDLIPKKYNTDYILEDISEAGVHPNYSGVIAGRLCGSNNKNTACFIRLDNDMVKGSFRGRNQETNYRKYFEDYREGLYAQGHETAFGFRCKYDELVDIMSKLNTIEKEVDNRVYLSVGDMPESERGIYHILDFNDFKKNAYLLRLGVGNSKVSSSDEIYIKVNARDVILADRKGKLFIYNVLGLQCKAFEQLSGEYFKLYLEFTNELCAFIKPL